MSHDTWIHRVARVTVVKPLIHTAVTPNQVTTARLLTGIAAAAALAQLKHELGRIRSEALAAQLLFLDFIQGFAIDALVSGGSGF
mgnify:CR=1 FL=1